MIFFCGTRRYVAGRVFCIGRNYAEHARELANPVPEAAPLVFMKPREALWKAGKPVPLPPGDHEVHMETELVVLLGENTIAGLALGLDLTRRALQAGLKEQGHPWERAKAFEASAPIGPWTPFHPKVHPLDAIQFEGWVNGERRQRGSTNEMLFPVEALLGELSKTWTLRPGDVIYTGTPAGVGPLRVGDRVEVRSPQLSGAHWEIIG
jgi:2-keto-4-pentenoate hydratase/2-oxohepta-3-ene-1,7-dioic acid hydratase in catechol pathway